MKRIQLYILILTVCCLLIIGCSSSSVDETAPSNETATETIITEAETGNDSVPIGSDEAVSESAETCTDENSEHDHAHYDEAFETRESETSVHSSGGGGGGTNFEEDRKE